MTPERNTTYHVMKEFMVNSPAGNPKGIFLMAHGAGRGMANPFMETIATGLVASGVRVVRFHFPYMERMVRTGKKISPDGGGVLRRTFNEVIAHCIEMEHCPAANLIIGGKSTGARIASMVADENKVAGVICFGYPFHPPRKPNLWRMDHLEVIDAPTLICQGERDPFGSRQEVTARVFSPSVAFKWLEDGDHNFCPPGTPAPGAEVNMQAAIAACNAFIDRVL